MVDRVEQGEEQTPEIKQESAIQAVVAAQRELSDQSHLDREEEEIIRRRRMERALVRRPSYRKILTELGGHHNMINPEEREQSENDSGTSEDLHSNEDNSRLGGLADRLGGGQDRHFQNNLPQPLRIVPTGALLGNGGSMPAMEGANAPHLNHAPSLHNNQGGPHQYSPPSENGDYSGFYGGGGGLGGVDDSTSYPARKREIRLLKNREAARECRRKKKEYIKCLENRVAVLENQNKALIEELKSLKELYTGGKMG